MLQDFDDDNELHYQDVARPARGVDRMAVESGQRYPYSSYCCIEWEEMMIYYAR